MRKREGGHVVASLAEKHNDQAPGPRVDHPPGGRRARPAPAQDLPADRGLDPPPRELARRGDRAGGGLRHEPGPCEAVELLERVVAALR